VKRFGFSCRPYLQRQLPKATKKICLLLPTYFQTFTNTNRFETSTDFFGFKANQIYLSFFLFSSLLFFFFFSLKKQIANIKQQFDDHLVTVRQQLRLPKLEYVTKVQTEYLLEIPVARAKTVPEDWLRVNSTKTMVRFHTPTVQKLLKQLAQARDLLQIAAQQAWTSFLRSSLSLSFWSSSTVF
jgi:LAS superfamily LD-carboxypeptidase LdcB